MACPDMMQLACMPSSADQLVPVNFKNMCCHTDPAYLYVYTD